ncbi:sugar-binding domain-containing protein [Granulicella tundricola]|uniref:sugar-binding domain-containing protein n=1 Tax=Granulicella tundricola TaxID=940615 RepID=UPI0001DB81A8|nr:sugar-binding domain-containing protein [Granulicella tundricola]
MAATAQRGASAWAKGREAVARTTLPLNRKWRYKPARVEGAHLVTFNDAAFEPVVIPHTNVTLPWHSLDEKDYAIISTYCRRFRTSAAAKGKRVFVDFEGAIPLRRCGSNGVSLGEYKGGSTPFSFDLTEHLHHDGENVLVVQLDSTERPDIPTFGYEIDYLTFGGLSRSISADCLTDMYRQHLRAAKRRAERYANGGCRCLPGGQIRRRSDD